MAIALTLLWIGAGIIVVGIVLACVGIILDRPPGPRRADSNGFLAQLLRLATRCFRIIVDPNSSRWAKLAALGMMLIFLGLAFLVGSAVSAVVGIAAGGASPATPSGTPTPTST